MTYSSQVGSWFQALSIGGAGFSGGHGSRTDTKVCPTNRQETKPRDTLLILRTGFASSSAMKIAARRLYGRQSPDGATDGSRFIPIAKISVVFDRISIRRRSLPGCHRTTDVEDLSPLTDNRTIILATAIFIAGTGGRTQDPYFFKSWRDGRFSGLKGREFSRPFRTPGLS
jgi:hypothetical protein